MLDRAGDCAPLAHTGGVKKGYDCIHPTSLLWASISQHLLVFRESSDKNAFARRRQAGVYFIESIN
jgi:hypothetical protein